MVLVLLLGLLCGAGTVWAAVGRDATVSLPVQRSAVVVDGPREVLRAWDAARADAWLRGDVDALAALYAPRSRAGAHDVAMLRRWNARGRRVTRLTTQVLRLRVVHEGPRRLVLVVTDRAARAESGRTLLPVDLPTTRRIELVRGGAAGWLVGGVSEVRWRAGSRGRGR